MPPRRARDGARALAAIHAAGVVHRDVKPENVLITRDHVVKVMDLGVARLEDEALRLSQTGAFVGSVLYAAPEQFASREGASTAAPTSTRSASSLYELATGTHPFGDDDCAVVVRSVARRDAASRLGELNPQLSPVLRGGGPAALLEKDRDAAIRECRGRAARVLERGRGVGVVAGRARRRSARTTRRPLRRIRIPRETALYGRDAELATLRALFDAAKAGDGQVVLVEGEAGIGKSRARRRVRRAARSATART